MKEWVLTKFELALSEPIIMTLPIIIKSYFPYKIPNISSLVVSHILTRISRYQHCEILPWSIRYQVFNNIWYWIVIWISDISKHSILLYSYTCQYFYFSCFVAKLCCSGTYVQVGYALVNTCRIDAWWIWQILKKINIQGVPQNITHMVFA